MSTPTNPPTHQEMPQGQPTTSNTATPRNPSTSARNPLSDFWKGSAACGLSIAAEASTPREPWSVTCLKPSLGCRLSLWESSPNQLEPATHLCTFVAEGNHELQSLSTGFPGEKRRVAAESFEFLDDRCEEPILHVCARLDRIEAFSGSEERLARIQRFVVGQFLVKLAECG